MYSHTRYINNYLLLRTTISLSSLRFILQNRIMDSQPKSHELMFTLSLLITLSGCLYEGTNPVIDCFLLEISSRNTLSVPTTVPFSKLKDATLLVILSVSEKALPPLLLLIL